MRCASLNLWFAEKIVSEIYAATVKRPKRPIEAKKKQEKTFEHESNGCRYRKTDDAQPHEPLQTIRVAKPKTKHPKTQSKLQLFWAAVGHAEGVSTTRLGS